MCVLCLLGGLADVSSLERCFLVKLVVLTDLESGSCVLLQKSVSSFGMCVLYRWLYRCDTVSVMCPDMYLHGVYVYVHLGKYSEYRWFKLN